jgi:hypothetical protein
VGFVNPFFEIFLHEVSQHALNIGRVLGLALYEDFANQGEVLGHAGDTLSDLIKATMDDGGEGAISGDADDGSHGGYFLSLLECLYYSTVSG